jgi:hypothetical protein
MVVRIERADLDPRRAYVLSMFVKGDVIEELVRVVEYGGDLGERLIANDSLSMFVKGEEDPGPGRRQ